MRASPLAHGRALNNIIKIIYRKHYIIGVWETSLKEKKKSIEKFRYLIDRRLSANENVAIYLVYIIVFEGLGEEWNKKKNSQFSQHNQC